REHRQYLQSCVPIFSGRCEDQALASDTESNARQRQSPRYASIWSLLQVIAFRHPGNGRRRRQWRKAANLGRFGLTSIDLEARSRRDCHPANFYSNISPTTSLSRGGLGARKSRSTITYGTSN